MEPWVLKRLQAGVLRSTIIEDLNLDAGIRRITHQRRADADAVVGVLGQLDVEPQHEVRVLFLGIKVAAVLLGREDHAVLDLVALSGLVLLAVGALAVNPAGQVLAVEQRGETLFGRRLPAKGQRRHNGGSKQSQMKRKVSRGHRSLLILGNHIAVRGFQSSGYGAGCRTESALLSLFRGAPPPRNRVGPHPHALPALALLAPLVSSI